MILNGRVNEYNFTDFDCEGAGVRVRLIATDEFGTFSMCKLEIITAEDMVICLMGRLNTQITHEM